MALHATTIRFADRAYTAIARAADEQGISVSQYVRERAEDDGVQVLVVFGEIDIVTAPACGSELQALHRDAPAVLDFCATDFMDSSGLAVLLDQARSFPAGGLRLACEPDGPLTRLLRMANTHQALRVHASRDEALEAAHSRP